MDSNANLDYQKYARAKWQDQCRVVSIDNKLVAMPYVEAAKESDYILGATMASIMANRLIRRLLEETKK